ncbi:hypothetical protein BC828DRAFT_388349 [Blastocladiella britannica]|nr:hypothetical protein BC828DRAFT_388349 [Blastocladiella britannica]
MADNKKHESQFLRPKVQLAPRRAMSLSYRAPPPPALSSTASAVPPVPPRPPTAAVVPHDHESLLPKSPTTFAYFNANGSNDALRPASSQNRSQPMPPDLAAAVRLLQDMRVGLPVLASAAPLAGGAASAALSSGVPLGADPVKPLAQAARRMSGILAPDGLHATTSYNGGRTATAAAASSSSGSGSTGSSTKPTHRSASDNNGARLGTITFSSHSARRPRAVDELERPELARHSTADVDAAEQAAAAAAAEGQSLMSPPLRTLSESPLPFASDPDDDHHQDVKKNTGYADDDEDDDGGMLAGLPAFLPPPLPLQDVFGAARPSTLPRRSHTTPMPFLPPLPRLDSVLPPSPFMRQHQQQSTASDPYPSSVPPVAQPPPPPPRRHVKFGTILVVGTAHPAHEYDRYPIEPERLGFPDKVHLLELRSLMRRQHALAHAPETRAPPTGATDHRVCGCGRKVPLSEQCTSSGSETEADDTDEDDLTADERIRRQVERGLRDLSRSLSTRGVSRGSRRSGSDDSAVAVTPTTGWAQSPYVASLDDLETMDARAAAAARSPVSVFCSSSGTSSPGTPPSYASGSMSRDAFGNDVYVSPASFVSSAPPAVASATSLLIDDRETVWW